MCGIIGGYLTESDLWAGVKALAHRGPDAAAVWSSGLLAFGHTRLAILDLDHRSDQPFTYHNLVLVYNGELWNYKEIRAELRDLGHTFTTSGDTEVVAAALRQWGVQALPKFNGMFALAWTAIGTGVLYLARDRFGEMPLHIAYQRPFLFASELKGLLALGANPKSFQAVPPGAYIRATVAGMRVYPYYDAPLGDFQGNRAEAADRLKMLLYDAVTERRIADVPVCTLLSGGLDSSITAYFLSLVIPDLVAYTAVYNPKSRDLKTARLVADHLGIELREVVIPTPTADDLAEVIRVIEMPYKAQVEIGWPCLVLARQMQADGFKVTFSGEGSDELWASYGFAYHALKTEPFGPYRKALFLTQERKNFNRCNKIFMGHSIECRLPFLNPTLVEFALSLPESIVADGRRRPKAVLEDAFQGLLPDAVTHRPKVAFQDGLGLKDAIADQLAVPERFYRAEFARLYQ